MMESRRHAGQWRRMGPPPVPTQSFSRVRCARESDIKSIVIVGRLRFAALTWPRSKADDGAPLHSAENSRLEKNTAFRLDLFLSTIGSDWPVSAVKLVVDLAGESPAGANFPVGTVVISGGGAGDQTVESPEVNVLVGWVTIRSAPTKESKQSSRS
jgi:hypothetical protein